MKPIEYYTLIMLKWDVGLSIFVNYLLIVRFHTNAKTPMIGAIDSSFSVALIFPRSSYAKSKSLQL